MKYIRKIAFVADSLLIWVLTFVAVFAMIYSGYVIYDNFYKSKVAFSSWDLKQYKPTVEQTKLGFEEISLINPDTVAWLTVEGTNIDYPVMYGSNNMDYINRDFYGKSSLTGSIYLNSDNSPDFSQPYNLIYGHHMDNGAMFGDIDKFASEEYLKSHTLGILMTPTGNYDLYIFACMQTDAYNDTIYFKDTENEKAYGELFEHISKNSLVYIPQENIPQKIIAMSTCAETGTFGRTVIFAKAISRTDTISKEEVHPQVKRTAKGHNTVTEHWAVLNLVCVILTLLTLFPLHYTFAKYNQLIFVRKKKKECEEEAVAKDLGRFEKKIYIGFIVEILIFTLATVFFLRTENIKNDIGISDKYTLIMILIFALSLIVDIICFRYRGKRPDNDAKGEEAE